MSARTAELLAIGSELLGPSRLDTNGLFLSRRLGERGIPVRFRTIVGDDREDLRQAFEIALSRADVIVATGGLGPTVDDFTREVVADLLGLPLEMDDDLLRGIEERFRRHGTDMPPQNRRQAMVPRGAVVLKNRLGTAPGLLLRVEERALALLPGVPSEMRAMMDEELLPLLGEADGRLAHRVLKIAGLTESEVDRRLLDVHRSAGAVEWTILASPGQVEIHLREEAGRSGEAPGLDRLHAAIAATLGAHLFGQDEETLEVIVGRLLVARGESLGVAESLTGGMVSQRLTAAAGASRYFRGGIVCYSDDAKRDLVGVDAGTLEARGAVSAETAQEMAAGVRERLRADWGLATTGFAGPEAGGPDRPAGTLFVGVAGPSVARTRELLIPGDRDLVRERSTQVALDFLRRALQERSA